MTLHFGKLVLHYFNWFVVADLLLRHKEAEKQAYTVSRHLVTPLFEQSEGVHVNYIHNAYNLTSRDGLV